MVIKQLSPETINLISAGEVIEGPSDILKELIENSIDADATEIIIEIKNSGIDYLQVKDNGTGITKEDLLICTKRHTTSKLKTIDDLYSINSFGFRGEALASISSVSRVSIISSTNELGKGYVFEENNLNEISASKGTTITIKDLFYNLPVRKKFLKSKSTEFTYIYDIFLSFVLAHPNIRFVFNSEKKKVVFQNTTRENRMQQIFGAEVNKKTISLNITNELFELSGLVSNPRDQFYFPTNFLFINNRLVYATQVQKAISSAYRDYLMVQQKPFFVLFLKFNPNTIDVNVHPKKRIVKIQNELLFLSILKTTLESKIYFPSSTESITHSLFEYDFKKSNNPILNDSSKEYIKKFDSNSSEASLNKSLIQKTTPSNSPSIFNSDFATPILSIDKYTITKVLGQIHNTYIFCQTEYGYLIIDQHAAAERINLEKNRQLYSNSFVCQKLLLKKKIINLSESHKKALDEQKSNLKSVGFDYEKINGDYYLITIPKLFNDYFDENIFLNLITDLVEGDDSVTKLKDNLIKLFTCKNSIKANEPLSYFDQIKLIKELNNCKDKLICAHGRPTIMSFTITDLEKMFKRVV